MTRGRIGILYQQPVHAQTHWIYQQKAGLFLFPLKKTSSNCMTLHSKTLTLVLCRTEIVKSLLQVILELYLFKTKNIFQFLRNRRTQGAYIYVYVKSNASLHVIIVME